MEDGHLFGKRPLGAFEIFCAAILLAGSASAQTVGRVSISSSEVEGNERSFSSSVSADGRYVAFTSDASNLIAGDTNGVFDIFLRDTLLGTTERVSIADNETQANYDSFQPSMSADGRFVVFLSDATNLVTGDTNGLIDAFVRDRFAKTTQRVSVDSAGVQANEESLRPSVSANGRFVVFSSAASNLTPADSNSVSDVFLWDRLTLAIEMVSLGSNEAQGNGISEHASVSADGRFVAFESAANNFAAGDNNNNDDVFVRDRLNGTTELISRAMSAVGGGAGNSYGATPSMTPDGRFVAFAASASDLVEDDTNGSPDIFVRDRQTGTTERVNVSIDGEQTESGSSYSPLISANGRIIAFQSNAPNLVGYLTNGVTHIFVRDRLLGTTERATIDNMGVGLSGLQGGVSLSANGRFVAFASLASDFVEDDTNAVSDVFLRDRGPRPGVRNDVLLDLGGEGLWQWLNNRALRRLTITPPIAIATGNLDNDPKQEVIASSQNDGIRVYYNNVAYWDERLHATPPSQLATGEFDGNGKDEIVADFNAGGLWVRYDNARWAKLHIASPDLLTTADLDTNIKDELVAVFPGGGIWARFNNANWLQLHSQTPGHIVPADLDGNGKDELVVEFGVGGLWVRKDNGAWTKLHNSASEGLAAGDLNGNGKADVLVDFGAGGLWARYDSGAWVKLHATSPTQIVTVDADSSGKDDAVVDFGSSVWVRYNDSRWQLLRASPSEGLVAGGFD